jgi:hypothetical protein
VGCLFNLVTISLVEEAVFSPSYVFDTFIKNKVGVAVWIYICVLYSVPLVFICFVPWCFYCYGSLNCSIVWSPVLWYLQVCSSCSLFPWPFSVCAFRLTLGLIFQSLWGMSLEFRWGLHWTCRWSKKCWLCWVLTTTTKPVFLFAKVYVSFPSVFHFSLYSFKYFYF